MRKAFLAGIMLAALASLGIAQDKALLMQRPAMNKTHIVFSYAGDLWIVARAGGEAERLTTGVGLETNPAFSPDGRTIAFTGEYDGNRDVYTIPATGGVPKRLTWHPSGDDVVGWTPDGSRIVFSSDRNSFNFFLRLFTIEPDGKFPTEVPLPMAEIGSFSPDGTRIAYEPINQWQPDWKRYAGGQADRIWIARLSDSSIEKIPQDNSNDRFPMWIGDRIFFLSDRGPANGAWTLWSYDLKTKKVAQAIPHNGFDLKSASAEAGANPEAIVYEQFGSIGIYDLKSGRTRAVPITIRGDLASVRPHYEKVGARISWASISPTGARAVFEARGEILSVPAEKGNVRNLTNTSGAAERDPAWSPDGKWIAYLSDESGEYALHLRDQKGAGEVKKIALPPAFYYAPTWSPDSKKIAFSDKYVNLWYVDIDKGTPVKVATSNSDQDRFAPAWSPDSRWLAYHATLKTWMHAVSVYNIEEAKSHQISDGLSDAMYPQFDRSGKYLYFTASTDIGPTLGGFDMSVIFTVHPTRSVYVAVLRKTDPSPLAPESDEEKVADEAKKDDAAKPAEKPAEKLAEKTADKAEKKDAPQVTIDFENIGQRTIALPVPNREYVGLVAGGANTLYLLEVPTINVNAIPDEPVGATLSKFDLEKRKQEKLLENLQSFTLSANGEKMLYHQGPNWFITPVAGGRPGEGRLRVEEMEIQLDPRAEWAQMYREVWRIERDFFYAPNYHGLDLQAAAKRYEPFLASVAHREDLSYLFRDMLGELTVGHMFVRGGDKPEPKQVPGGLLGCDYKIENGRYRFARVYNGENWNAKMRAPLTQPGVNVVAGEYLLAVNGRDVTSGESVYRFFENTAGKSVVIKVGPNPDGTGAREVTVVPVPEESSLRYLAWIEDNRRKVYELSGGQLAYVHLPDTALGGYTNFNRYYFSQLDKQGAVVDERFNSGGVVAEYVIDFLRKPILSYWTGREGMEMTSPGGVIPGPKVMLINEYGGSGGDLMPWMFRQHKVGKLIGKRTWGGLVGIGGYPQLVDGGMVTAPHFAFYSADGKWEVENHGVAPDIEVEWDPAAWRQGRDLQLEKAVSIALEELKANPVKRPQRPAYPNYHPARPAAAGNGQGN